MKIKEILPIKEGKTSIVDINIDVDKIKSNVEEKKSKLANKIISYLDKKYNKKEKWH